MTEGIGITILNMVEITVTEEEDMEVTRGQLVTTDQGCEIIAGIKAKMQLVSPYERRSIQNNHKPPQRWKSMIQLRMTWLLSSKERKKQKHETRLILVVRS